METKVCSKCEQSIPVSEFYKSKNTKDGYQPYCKPCYKDNAKTNYYDKREHYIEKVRERSQSTEVKARNKERSRERRKSWIEFFSSIVDLKCSRCGYDKSYVALEFHHIDPKTKEYEVSRMIGNKTRDKEREELVKKEVAKCILLCANCHRETHSHDDI